MSAKQPIPEGKYCEIYASNNSRGTIACKYLNTSRGLCKKDDVLLKLVMALLKGTSQLIYQKHGKCRGEK